MLQWVIKKIVGSKNHRTVKKIWPIVREINRIEEELQSQPDDVLRQKSADWKKELSGISDHVELARRLEEILPEAFAVVKSAARRLCGKEWNVCDHPIGWEMVHFDVQLIGGTALHRGMIAEMATGEGKTLVATLPVFLNALTGRGVHIITVNDYLARRDSEWMGEVFRFLGLTVGCIQNDQPPPVRRGHYACDITYGTASEFGFDYLRDNGMASRPEDMVQRGHYYALIDEVDSILIDEARTPLIISGPVTVSTHQYDRFKPLVEQLVKRQNLLCNDLASEAKTLNEAGDVEAAATNLFKVKLGQPRNRSLMRMMEDPEIVGPSIRQNFPFIRIPRKRPSLRSKKSSISRSTKKRTMPIWLRKVVSFSTLTILTHSSFLIWPKLLVRSMVMHHERTQGEKRPNWTCSRNSIIRPSGCTIFLSCYAPIASLRRT